MDAIGDVACDNVPEPSECGNADGRPTLSTSVQETKSGSGISWAITKATGNSPDTYSYESD